MTYEPPEEFIIGVSSHSYNKQIYLATTTSHKIP